MSNKYLGSLKCCLLSVALFIGLSASETFAVELIPNSELTLNYFTDTQSSGDDDDSSSDAVCPTGTYPVYSSGDDDSSSGDEDSNSGDDDSSSGDDDSSSSDEDSKSEDDDSSSGDDDSKSDDDDSSSSDEDSNSGDDDSSSGDDDSKSSDEDSKSEDDDSSSSDEDSKSEDDDSSHDDNDDGHSDKGKRTYECVADCTRKTISIGENIQKAEPIQGSINYNFTLNLDSSLGPNDCLVEIMFKTQDGGIGFNTAKQGLDYEAKTGTVEFALGESEKIIPVKVLADAVNDEEVEAFTITITKSKGADINKASALGLINFEFLNHD